MMNAPLLDQDFLSPTDAETLLSGLARQLRGGTIIPYIGPGLAQLTSPTIPMTPEELAAYFGSKVALPRPRQRQPLGRRAAYRKLQASFDGDQADERGFRAGGRTDAIASASGDFAAAADRRHLV